MSELNKAEKYLIENLKRLSETGYKDENPRGRYKSDGELSHSISIRGSVNEIFDLSKDEFPITETRPIGIKTAISEMLVIYQLQSNKIKDFEDNGCGWWSDWSVGDGTDIGFRYGYTVAKYDLMNKLLDGLETNPFGKRHIMDLYQYADLMSSDGLHPCAFLTMWSISKVNEERYLDLTLIQRSSDALVAGTGINQMQYVALQMMVAKHLGIKVGLFEHSRKNWHIYDRHLPQVKETITRLSELKARKEQSKPKLVLNVPDGTNFYDIKVDDFELINYNPIKPQLKFDLAL
jgi:thymidylate synthase